MTVTSPPYPAIIGDGWIETVRQFGRRFKTAVGRPDVRRPWLHAGARPGSKAAMPPPWPFDSQPFGHRACPTDGWTARIAS